jgi:hypothetical protein
MIVSGWRAVHIRSYLYDIRYLRKSNGDNIRTAVNNFDASVAQRHGYLHEARFHTTGDEKSQEEEISELQQVMFFGFKEK